MAPARKGKVKEEQPVVTLGPQAKEGENVFGVAHIFASFNDTFVHITDFSGMIATSSTFLYILYLFSTYYACLDIAIFRSCIAPIRVLSL